MLNRIQVLLDAFVLVLAYFLSWYLRFESGLFVLDEWYYSRGEYMRLLILIIPEYLILYYLFHLYVPKRVLGRRLEAWRVVQANVIGVMVLILFLYLTKKSDIFFLMNIPNLPTLTFPLRLLPSGDFGFVPGPNQAVLIIANQVLPSGF